MRVAAFVPALAAATALLAAPAVAGAPTQIGATAHDDDDSVPGMTLTLSPSALPKADPGPAEIELYNAGEDPHDMVVKRVGGQRKFQYPELEPGGSHELEIRLRKRSRYNLWCTLAGHRSQGMEASLKVRGRAG